jgi:hypothetical protein
LDFGHGGVNASKKLPRDILVLVLGIVVVIRHQHRLMTMLVVGLRRQHCCLVAMALLVECEGLPGASVSSLLAGASGSSLLAGASGLLVEELLTTALVLLAGASAGASGVHGKELLEASSLLAGTSGLLIEELLEAGSLVAPGASGFASGLLVEELLKAGSFVAPGASGFHVKELLAAGSLLASASTALVLLLPFLPWKGGTGCPGGGLRPLDLQPHLRFGEGGRGQMGRR